MNRRPGANYLATPLGEKKFKNYNNKYSIQLGWVYPLTLPSLASVFFLLLYNN